MKKQKSLNNCKYWLIISENSEVVGFFDSPAYDKPYWERAVGLTVVFFLVSKNFFVFCTGSDYKMSANLGSNNNGGRRLKPLDQLKGNIGAEEREAREKAENEMQKLIDLPEKPPSYLPTYGKKLWKSIVPQLKTLESIKQLDQTTPEQMCVFYDCWIRATHDIKENGFSIDGRKNPAYNVLSDSGQQMRKCASLLGLTFDSRMRLVLPECF